MSNEIKTENNDNNEDNKEENPESDFPVNNEIVDRTSVHSLQHVEEDAVGEENYANIEAKTIKAIQENKAYNIKYGPSMIVQEFLQELEDTETLMSDSSSVSSAGSVGSFIQDTTPNFLLDIEEFPRLSEISIDTRRSTKKSIKSDKIYRSVENLAGSFVDPLTGEIEISQDSENEEEQEEEIGEEEENLTFEIEEDKELLILFEKDKEEEQIEALLHQEELLEQKDVMELFLEATELKVVIVEPEIDLEALERERNLKLMQKAINDYLKGLISRIVEACEYVDVKAIMRESLDKKKLLAEMITTIGVYKLEQKVQTLVNRKVVEFFRKKKSGRVFTEDNAETIISEKNRCKLLWEKVDSLLGEESTHKKFVADQIESLTICLDELRKSYLNEVYNFETLVKNAFIREKTSDKFKLALARHLRQINTKRQEIEETRLVIRNKQHTFAILHQKLQSVDKLGDGLEIGDYERLGTKIYELDKKIEEQNNNLNKMRLRCHANLHMLTHMKEKANMMRCGLELQKDILERLYEKKADTREALWLLKIDHEIIRKKIYLYSFQGGLVNKPDLMFDYDDTLSHISVLQAKLDKFKRKHDDITAKIEILRQHECEI